MIGAIIRGALLATVLAFPLAAICAALYRFPVPFAGYQSGLAAIPSVLVGAVFYASPAALPFSPDATAAFKAINELCVEMLTGDYQVVRHVELREE